MKSILEYIQEKLNIIEPSIPIVEMATIAVSYTHLTLPTT